MTLFSLAIFLEAAAATAAAARLIWLGSARREPALTLFLCYVAVASAALSSAPPRSLFYFWTFVVSTALNWVLSVYAVREMFALALDEYPGIRTAGRWAMYTAVGIAVTAASAVTTVFWRGGANGRSGIFYVLVLNRSILFTLAVVVLAIVFFLSRYPLHLHRNTYISCFLFAAAFLAEACVQLIDTLQPHLFSRYLDVLGALFSAACFSFWAVLLRRERTPASSRITFESPDEGELLRQLESLNQLLSRAGRR
jgi:hypothetical protein